MDLIEEAKKRGYIAGTEIKYITKSDNINVLGRGEFEINNGRLLKYEYPKKERDCFDKSAYDVIYCPHEGWTLIINNKKMSWILFVFKRSFHHYLVPAENEDDAWIQLSNKQSMSIDNCKKQYSLRGKMDGKKIWKI